MHARGVYRNFSQVTRGAELGKTDMLTTEFWPFFMIFGCIFDTEFVHRGCRLLSVHFFEVFLVR